MTPHDARFEVDTLFECQFSTSAGEIGLLAEVAISGETLTLKDVAVYPTLSVYPAKVGMQQVLRALRELEEMARAQGYTHLVITGERLSGASPGRSVTISREL